MGRGLQLVRYIGHFAVQAYSFTSFVQDFGVVLFIICFFSLILPGRTFFLFLRRVLLALHLQDRRVDSPGLATGTPNPTSEIIQGRVSSGIGIGPVNPCIQNQQVQPERARVVSPFGDAHSPHTVAGARGWE